MSRWVRDLLLTAIAGAICGLAASMAWLLAKKVNDK